jgi:D-serine deaminase-like pyridoxal phosphate-dependent protein
MARYCQRHGVTLAPHATTPMAPQIVERQLKAGAWGITVATVQEARVFRAVGARRLLLANELLEPRAVEWVAGELATDPDFEFYCLVDSLEGVARLNAALDRADAARPLDVLLELGTPGGRAGCRSLEEAREIAGAVRAAPHLRLVGLEGYEGAVSAPTFPERVAAVDRFLLELRQLAAELFHAGLFDRPDEVIVSAGGSVFFDRVVELLAPPWEFPVRPVLRSGSYVTHDSDTYEQLSPLAGRAAPGEERLQPALELWSLVLSQPEPGLAIAGFGKRDVSYDLALPTPFCRKRGGEFREICGEVTVTALNDQHAYLRVDPGFDLAVGDLVGCRISHPCTAFDKWRLLPLVDQRYEVTGAVKTFF